MVQMKKSASKFTEQELKVLKLLTIDSSNAEISKELHIREKTVEKIIEKLMVKFYATSRTNLAVKAVPLFL